MGIGQSTQTINQRDAPRDERPNKRIKQSGPEISSGSASRFFASSRTQPLEQIEDDEATAKHLWPLVQRSSTRESSYAETVGGSSIASNSKTPKTPRTAAAACAVQEYRHVQRMSTAKRSRRRRRQPRKPDSSPVEIDDDTSAVAHRNLPPQHSHAPTSPDCLSMNDHSNENPPPANITSDIPFQPKRSAAEYAQSVSKRYKVHKIGSEDELSKPGTSAGRETTKKSTIIGKLVSQSPQSRTQRGDIKPTNFGSPVQPVAQRQNLTTAGPKEDEVVLETAACGKYMYSAESAHEPVKLLLNSN
ncbi:hypothetical protein ACLX1H_005342 [Fusarium chlamydosporum]